ncbi:MAG: hypothetical protein EYC70_09300 [Planctomycetota bacterium]|nr:MAG: hypothetical protein EYC70_09300 [Planctomycetota bacterium]
MNPERWHRIKQILFGALDLPSEERRAFLERSCGADADLLAEVSQLLQHYGCADQFMAPSQERDLGADSVCGERIGDFILLHELGGGSSGTVYKARQLSLDRLVALKVLSPLARRSQRQARRFEREGPAVARLRHPNIVQVYLVGTDGPLAYIAMEYVEGMSLAQSLARDAAMSPRVAATLVLKLARALHHAHGNGVIHRDVKPQNILLGMDGEPRLVDFGLAKLAEHASLTAQDDVEGTPNYMSPEQTIATGTVDRRTDIFSLGVILYECLTHVRPFDAPSAPQVLLNIQHKPPRDPRLRNPAVPSDLALICAKALEKSPALRYQSAADLAADLHAFLTHHAISATAPHPVTIGLRWAYRRRRLLIAGASIAAGVLVVGLLSLAWQQRRHVDAQLQRLEAQATAIDPTDVQGVLRFSASVDEFGRERTRMSAANAARLDALRARRVRLAEHLMQAGLDQVRDGLGQSASDSGPFRTQDSQKILQGTLLYSVGRGVALQDGAGAIEAADFLSVATISFEAADGCADAALYMARTAESPFSGFAPLTLIGSAPLREYALQPGDYRFVAVLEDGRWCDIMRRVDLRTPRHVVQLRLDMFEAQPARMRHVPEGTISLSVTLDQEVGPMQASVFDVDYCGFWVDENPVSVGEFAEFCRATGRACPWTWAPGFAENRPTLPATGITWDEAVAYAEWKGKRLPTYAEREVATRGPWMEKFPWGERPLQLERFEARLAGAVCSPPAKHDETGHLLPIDDPEEAAFLGPYGLRFTLWGVMEWTATPFCTWGPAGAVVLEEMRYTRGMSFQHSLEDLRTHGLTTYAMAPLHIRVPTVGFRCVRGSPP